MIVNDELNKKETAKNVRIFLNKELDNYLMLADANIMKLTTPTISNMPKIRKVSNDGEDLISHIFNAQIICKSLGQAIINLTNNSKKPYKTIIESVYINKVSNIATAHKIGYSESQYRRIKQKALCELAIRFTHYQILNEVEQVINLCNYAT